MPNVAEVIRDHVTLAVECVDRLYLNASVPGLQRGPGVVAFLRQRGQVIASPALFGEITNIFKAALGQYCSTRTIPWIEFTKGQDKDKLVETYRQQFGLDPVRWTFLMSRAESRENVHDDSAFETLLYPRVQSADR